MEKYLSFLDRFFLLTDFSLFGRVFDRHVSLGRSSLSEVEVVGSKDAVSWSTSSVCVNIYSNSNHGLYLRNKEVLQSQNE